MTKDTVLYDEGGYTITLTKAKLFEVNGPEEAEHGRTFPTYNEAIERINKLGSAEKKRKKIAMALPAMADTGEKVTITGIHSSRGVILTSPKIEEGRKRSRHGLYSRDPEFYIDTPAVRAMILRQNALERELTELEQRLDGARIKDSSDYRHRDQDYDEKMKNFQERYEAAKAYAETLGEGAWADPKAAA